MSIIHSNLAALNILIPLFSGLFTAISYNVTIARIISIGCISCNLALSIYSLKLQEVIKYSFGDWQAPIGIEYRLDSLSKYILIYLNFVLIFILIFCHNLTKNLVLKSIQNKYRHLFYTILLFAHTGYLGMIVTEDLFNLYVFIEISALSAYVLISLGDHPKAPVGSFDYLIMGSIGASLILIAIGLLFSITGSLNMAEVKTIMINNNLYSSKIVLLATAFFIIGALLKIAFFPMHFWMVRAYSYSSSIVLTYLAAISGIIGSYLFLRFVHNVLDFSQIQKSLTIFLTPISYITIIICGLFAIKANNLRHIIIYSIASSVGYIIFFLATSDSYSILFPLLLVDSINKIGLFLIISYADSNLLKNTLLIRYLITIIVICNIGLPISSLFILKINMLEFALSKNLSCAFIVFITSFCLSLIYHYKMLMKLFSLDAVNEVNNNKIIAYDLISVAILQLLLLFYSNRIIEYTTILKLSLEGK